MIAFIVIPLLLWIFWPSKTKKNEILYDPTIDEFDDELHKN